MCFRRLVAEGRSERKGGREEDRKEEREKGVRGPRVVLAARDNGAGLSVCWIT